MSPHGAEAFFTDKRALSAEKSAFLVSDFIRLADYHRISRIRCGSKLYDIPRPQRQQRVKEALEFMGLLEAAHSLVRNYSGGMIRRLEIAQSMLHRPKVLFMDEPTVGLDPVARRAVWDHIKRLRNEYGMTIFLTTHYMEEAESICDRVAIMNRGVVVAVGSPAELKSSIGKPGATLDDVFTYYTGDTLESGGSYRDVLRVRRTARRLGWPNAGKKPEPELHQHFVRGYRARNQDICNH